MKRIDYFTNDKGLIFAGCRKGSRRQSNPGKVLATLTRKTLHILKLLRELGTRRTVFCFRSNQVELAERLRISRQALSIHLKRLRELGFVQVGRGFVNVTAEGLKAVGYNSNPVIVIVRIAPKNRMEALAKIRSLSFGEVFRVTGDYDIVLIVDQDSLDGILAKVSQVDGVLETKSLVTIEKS